MATVIFESDAGAEEERLTVQDNGRVSYYRSHNYKIEPAKIESLTAEEAKKRWPRYAYAIDVALAKLAAPEQPGS